VVLKKKSKLDYKKQFPDLYNSSNKECKIVDVPKMKFFKISGKGNSNTSTEFQNAIKVLYSASFTLKMKFVKKEDPNQDYVVPPLEALWYMENDQPWSMNNKENWYFDLMIRIPDHVKDEQIRKMIRLLEEKEDLQGISKLEVFEFTEGKCIQILHRGSYNEEPKTIKKMQEFIKKMGFELRGKHHEIYLSDPRRCKPQNLRTILRQPIRSKQ